MSTSSASVTQSASSSSTQLTSSSSMPSSSSSSPVMNTDESTSWSQSSATTMQAYNSIDSLQASPASSQLSSGGGGVIIRYQTNLEGEVMPMNLSASATGGHQAPMAATTVTANPVDVISVAVQPSMNQFEPELKKIKLTHYQIDGKLNASAIDPSQLSLETARLLIPQRKLEERIGGILSCTVCLDLPQTAIFQVSSTRRGCYSPVSKDLNDLSL